MKKVITYGTFDLLHYGHIRLLERAKALGDYLIVGVTADDFDKTRGKINVQQPLMERIKAVRATGIADEIIVEEYEGQKIDDIKRLNVDIFTVGSDWIGKFDYLNEYCRVVYLERTEGVSSSDIRSEERLLKIGVIGEVASVVGKYIEETKYVNGLVVSGVLTEDLKISEALKNNGICKFKSFDELLCNSDAVYIVSHPSTHFLYSERALEAGKHVLCESPIALKKGECSFLFDLAKKNGLVLMEAIKTAYATAYNRLLLLVKGGKIGNVYSIDSTCTSLRDIEEDRETDYSKIWSSICSWGPTAMLPVLQILGTDYTHKEITTCIIDEASQFDAFTKIDFRYSGAVASIKVGKAVKAEGNLIIAGSKGYVYVPAPWWKTDYFEIRYEDPSNNKRYFYQLDGEGIRYELVAFVKSIHTQRDDYYISRSQTEKIAEIMGDYYSERDVKKIDFVSKQNP